MTTEQKDWIDNASIEDLLRKWRFDSIGDPMFKDATGEYFAEVMKKKRGEDPAAYTAASKRLMRG